MNSQRKTTRGSFFIAFTTLLVVTGACDDPDDLGGISDLEVTDEAVPPAPEHGVPSTIDELAVDTPTAEAKHPCRILALGDSLTYGWNGNAAQQQDPSGNYLGGYRSHLVYGFAVAPSAAVGSVLMVGVRQDNSPPWLVSWGQSWHAGAPGFTNAQLATAVASGATNVAPDIILLHAGTNDILTAPAPKAANAVYSLYGLLYQIMVMNPDATVLLAKIIPVAGPLNAEVTAYNSQLDVVAANWRSVGLEVWTVDHNSGFPAASLEDGIHPNFYGYSVMASRWRMALDTVGCW